MARVTSRKTRMLFLLFGFVGLSLAVIVNL
jgi:hypothetical protein